MKKWCYIMQIVAEVGDEVRKMVMRGAPVGGVAVNEGWMEMA